jgi:hypothetical protein
VTDFLCAGTVDFRNTGLRAIAFFGVRRFGATFFLITVFLLALLFKETFALLVLRAGAFCAIALLAFGRAVLGVAARRLAADLGADRRAGARDVERLRPLVTALMSKLRLKGQMGHRRSGSCGGRVT